MLAGLKSAEEWLMINEDENSRLIIGWREWISMPSLGIPWIKAKVDTGAKTSALHAFGLSPFVDRGQLRVRFFVHPIQKRNDIKIECFADVIDHRFVSDSGGHREKRYVIEVPVIVGGFEYPMELTLANRDTMAFRMLFGRSAMTGFLLDPAKSFLLGRPKAPSRAYKKAPRKKL